MLTLVSKDILNVSKLNMGLLSINLVPFELTAKIQEVLKMFEVCVTTLALSYKVGSS
jgi:hypothetical protein